MSNKKHDFRVDGGIFGGAAGVDRKRGRSGAKDGIARKVRRRSARRREASFLFPLNASVQRVEDTDLPLVITSVPAEMRTLERLSTYRSRKGRPHFLPVQVVEPSKLNAGYDFGSLKTDGRKVFL